MSTSFCSYAISLSWRSLEVIGIERERLRGLKSITHDYYAGFVLVCVKAFVDCQPLLNERLLDILSGLKSGDSLLVQSLGVQRRFYQKWVYSYYLISSRCAHLRAGTDAPFPAFTPSLRGLGFGSRLPQLR